ncbi:YceI family protein [uncultured Hyphomicrobium sp.]|uniref:YceI family protein n=1 Tax=uncultured Hyphomicrobium sp. TaxID=194373 RepID=UPI0025D603B7|nr:YceI family protein [uncultured Hyphomicrobium sp.]
MKLRLTTLVLAAALALPGAAGAANYEIDTKGAHASINFRVKHLGFSWLTGRFDTFTGTFSYDPKAPEASKVNVEIDAASVSSNHAERDKHLRNTDFLDVAKFPKATFVSKKVEPAGEGKAKIVGDLTLRGVTKEVTLDAEYVGGGADPWGGNRVGFSGTTKLTLADYGINFNLGPDAKEVELTLNVEGVEKK